MDALSLRTLDGTPVEIDSRSLGALAEAFEGTLVSANSPDYDEVRAVWNAMIDRRPGLIARCTGPRDVAATMRLAADHDLLVSVRGAGHNIAGNAVCEGGLMIDLSLMREVSVDPEQKTARVAPGATLGDVDAATLAHGLALPMGINSTTGIAGLTLGGGFGWISRRWGLTIDSLRSAEIVLASGAAVHASSESHPDLFWALRGGGGNFGIVTSFEFDLHPVGPNLLSGLIVHPFAQAREALAHYREVAAGLPDDVAAWMVTRKAPPLPFLPEEVHGTEVVIFAVVCSGDAEAGRQALAPLVEWGEPIGVALGEQPFVAFQAAFDPLLTPGARNYWKSHNFNELPDGLVAAVVDFAGRLPSAESEIFIAQVGGAASRVAPDATAYWHRDARFVMNVHTRWTDPADDELAIAWAREFFEASSAFATGGVYVNFMPEDETARVGAAYGGNFERLAAVKATYDPGNRFRVNQNIPPAVE
jgi:FAD/FMN-containing dehydrogenase